MLSPITQRLIKAFQNIPGIGFKSAQRIAFHLLAQSDRVKANLLAQALQEAAQKVVPCSRCCFYTEEGVCGICSNPKRDATLLCVVGSPVDVVAIEQSSIYSGMYFVLQGHLSPLDGLGPQEIGIPALLNRLQEMTVRELIIATNPTTEGQATAHYILNHIDLTKIRCSRIAYGIPLGGELEYLDSGTLRHAFHSRRPIDN